MAYYQSIHQQEIWTKQPDGSYRNNMRDLINDDLDMALLESKGVVEEILEEDDMLQEQEFLNSYI